ncbi:MAG TPA: glycosyltransferase family A protein [Spirochaetota bacterium]
MKRGLVSVVIPMYNAERSIAKSVSSAIKQRYAHIEVIVVDDGSTDRSPSIVKKIIAQNPKSKIRMVRKQNGGVSSARNAGMRTARGEFIAFLDADDAWMKEKTALQIAVLNENPHVGMVGALISTARYRSGKDSEECIPITVRHQIFKNHFQTSTVIVRRSVVNEIGYFDETQRYAEEGDYWIRIIARFPALLLRRGLVDYDGGKPGFGTSGLSANLREMERGELKNIRYAFRAGIISAPLFFCGIIFSLAKYLRRVIIVRVRRR